MAHRFFSESAPANDQEQEVITTETVSGENPTDTAPIAGAETEHPAEVAAPAPVKAEKPVKSASKAPAKRPRASKKDSADGSKQKTLSIAISPKEHRELKVACIYADTSVTDFALGAIMDALHYTYACTSPDCGFQFTARTASGQEPPAASQCPFCGGRITRVKM